jgi:hypothetical protein
MSGMRGLHICSFASAIGDLTRKQQKDWVTVLSTLATHPRFSAFDASANQGIAKTMDALFARGYVREVGNDGYPWMSVELTDKGRAALAQPKEPT